MKAPFVFFFSAFRCFFIISSLLNVLFMIFLIFSKISIYWIKTFPFLLKNKCICFHQKFFYFILCQRHMHKDLNSPEIFVTNETFKILFTKRKLIRLYYLLISISFIQIGKYRNIEIVYFDEIVFLQLQYHQILYFLNSFLYLAWSSL